MMEEQRFNTGHSFVRQNKKSPRVQTVIDYLVTKDLAGKVVATRYVCAHTFAGQIVIDRDVSETTIARAKTVAVPDFSDLAIFAAYVWSFYRPQALYGNLFSHGLRFTDVMAAVTQHAQTASDFAGDSVDRERVRDIMLSGSRAQMAGTKPDANVG